MVDFTFPIEELEYFLLIMTRVTCFIFIAPFFSMQNTPRRLKIGLGFFISILLYYMTEPHVYPVFDTVWDMATVILKEAAAGLLIGLGANLCSSIVLFAGRVIDMEMGFAMANQMDPTTRENATLTGVYYQNMVMLLMIVTGMYQYFVSALAETFILIPVGQVNFNFDHILSTFVQFLGDYMVIGMKICLPVFCTIMLLNAILGILAKVAPQMNMFAVGIQLKVFTGLSVLFLTVALLPDAANMIFTQMKRMVVAFVEGMM
ncbi:MAG: flagellar biosynthetic protein FliR [Lachnospiraceae bacterium]|nr:flagellar biosynthetic protein FliR [Lachnospiraceae bacterium]